MLLLCACKAPQHPHVAPAAAVTIEVSRAGMALRGVAGDEHAAYVALAGGDKTVVEAYRGGQRAWQVQLPIDGGSLSAGGGILYVAGSARGAVRGDPGAVIVALDAATGATKWQLPLESTRWAHVASLAAADSGGGVIAGGAFAGTLRAHDKVVASAGDSDGFVARVDANGQLAWMIRMGGTYADAVQGVAVRGGTIAVAGTFTSGADFLGQALPPFDPASPMSDAFVASLDGGGARKWAATFGGKATDAVAGVALDDHHVVVAANARDIVHVGSSQLEAQGAADGLVAWLQTDGEKGPAILVGGLDFDGIDAIAAAGDDRVLVGGFFSGAMKLGPRTLSAGGGDDSFVALFDASSDVVASWQVGGEGREEIVGLAAIPGGFVAGVAHTAAANVEGGPPLPAPADPLTGAALVVRGLP